MLTYLYVCIQTLHKEQNTWGHALIGKWTMTGWCYAACYQCYWEMVLHTRPTLWAMCSRWGTSWRSWATHDNLAQAQSQQKPGMTGLPTATPSILGRKCSCCCYLQIYNYIVVFWQSGRVPLRCCAGWAQWPMRLPCQTGPSQEQVFHINLEWVSSPGTASDQMWACVVEEEELKEQYFPMAGGEVLYPSVEHHANNHLWQIIPEGPWGNYGSNYGIVPWGNYGRSSLRVCSERSQGGQRWSTMTFSWCLQAQFVRLPSGSLQDWFLHWNRRSWQYWRWGWLYHHAVSGAVLLCLSQRRTGGFCFCVWTS